MQRRQKGEKRSRPIPPSTPFFSGEAHNSRPSPTTRIAPQLNRYPLALKRPVILRKGDIFTPALRAILGDSAYRLSDKCFGVSLLSHRQVQAIIRGYGIAEAEKRLRAAGEAFSPELPTYIGRVVVLGAKPGEKGRRFVSVLLDQDSQKLIQQEQLAVLQEYAPVGMRPFDDPGYLHLLTTLSGRRTSAMETEVKRAIPNNGLILLGKAVVPPFAPVEF